MQKLIETEKGLGHVGETEEDLIAIAGELVELVHSRNLTTGAAVIFRDVPLVALPLDTVEIVIARWRRIGDPAYCPAAFTITDAAGEKTTFLRCSLGHQHDGLHCAQVDPVTVVWW